MGRNNQLPGEWRKEQARRQQVLQEQAAIARLNKAARFYDFALRIADSEATGRLKQAVPIDVTNVAELQIARHRSPFEIFKEAILAPAHPSVFLEYEVWDREHMHSLRMAAWMQWQEWDGQFAIHGVDISQDTKWIVTSTVHYQEPETPIIELVVLVDSRGYMVLPTGNTEPAIGTRVVWSPINTKAFLELWTMRSVQVFAIAAMGNTFMHCKNVEVLNSPPDPVTSLKYERHYGQPLTTYKVLKVTPMRKWRADAPAPTDDANRLPKSLHIARGHFKDYRNGAGLFGKYQDIFWWDAHVRGDEKRGVVVKDYEVGPE